MSQLLDRTKAPAVQSFTRLTIPQANYFTLDNGIKVVTLDATDRDLTRVTIAINGGLVESPVPGITMIAPELGNEGCKGFTGAQIADIIDYNGAINGANCLIHHTTASLTALSSRIMSLMPMFIGTITTPTYPAESVKAIADKAAARLAFNLERVSYIASRELSKLTKGINHRQCIDPTPESLRAITPEMMSDYATNRLNTNCLTVFITGRITDDILKQITSSLEQVVSTGPGYELDFMPYSPSKETHSAIYNKPGSLQSAIGFGIPSIDRRDPDYIKLRLAVMALGGYFGSRLMSNIREEKGLTYGIGASLFGGLEGSVINIMTETDNKSVKTVIEEVKNEMEAIKDPSTFKPDEIERLRRFMMSTLASTLDSPFAIMDLYANIIYNGTPANYYYQQQDEIRSMTAESIAETAGKYFDLNNLYISVAGNNVESL